MNPSRVVGLVAENSPDFIENILACWTEGAAVVVLRSRDDHSRVAAAHATEVRSATPGFGWLSKPHQPRFDDQSAQMLFTSGTEGEPKCVVLSHRNLADAVVRLNAAMQLSAEVREYVGVPVYHSFGFGRCRAVLAAGGQVYIPAHGFNPLEINAMLERGEINALSAVPSLWRVLLQSQAISHTAAARVRWIEIGSQFMAAQEKMALRALFHRAIIVQHYGLTEASRSTFLPVHSASAAHLESVGQASGEVEIAIAPGGQIQIRGPHVAQRLLDQGVAKDPRDAQGWFTTNDLGYLREGHLYYQGRADDVINCSGIKLSPDGLERAIAAQLNMQLDLVVCRVPDAVRGDGILVAVNHSVQASDDAILQATLAASAGLGVSARDATHVMRVHNIARTETGKVKRQQMAQDFVAASQPEQDLAQNATSLRGRLGAILGVQEVADRDTFVDLGGDSLSYIQVSMVLEQELGFLPDTWEQIPIAELEALQPRASRLSQIEPSVLLRALAIVSVVFNHAGVFQNLFAIDGAAMMLLLPAGYSFARFQLQRVLQSGQARMALAALPRVMVPALLLIALQQIRHHSFEPSALFMFHNFLPPSAVFGYWFIEVFVQIHLLLALLLWVPPIRAGLQRKPWAASMLTLLGSMLLSVGGQLVWNTDYLYNLLPHVLLPYFLMGCCIFTAKSAWQRWANAACLLVVVLLLTDARSTPASAYLWLVFGGVFLNWAPVLRMPALVVRACSAIASASLYIYISHFVTHKPVVDLLPGTGALAHAGFEILLGLAYWFCFEKAWHMVARLWTAARPQPIWSNAA